MLVNGIWTPDPPVPAPAADPPFANWITPDGTPGPTGEGGFPAEAGRYHLYAALMCPFSARAVLGRSLKQLEGVVGMTILNPMIGAQGWGFGGFPGAPADPVCGADFLHQILTCARPDYTGAVAVPILWDRQRRTIVSDSSANMLRMFNSAFAGLVPATPDLYPPALRPQIDALNSDIHHLLNQGVYHAGMAQSQADYDAAVTGIFTLLDRMEQQLSNRFLLGETITEPDIRLFASLIRFDLAYYGLFKVNLRQIRDYPRLWAFLGRMLRLPQVARTVDVDHIRAGYYSMPAVNPSGVVGLTPDHITALIAQLSGL